MLPQTFDLNGPLLQSALNEQPSLSLDFYSYGCILRKREGETVTEFPVDPQQVAMILSTKVSFDTGLLDGDTLLVRQDGTKRIVVAFRKRCKTGIWLDGSENALRVPLPELVMIRTTTDMTTPTYQVYATKGRPTALDAELFRCPLPNVFNSASVCWGTVQRVSDDTLSSASLVEDFSMLLGSPFGDHACSGKSKSHPSDVRKMLIELEARNARVYPRRDLIAANKTLAQAIGAI
jgi:Prokaryotic E2 family D